ncbi:MAG: ABC transporter permease [Chloroflexota bacterium]|nr:MAG: ABC transporter permease [Chloroflexota bacterium]
MARTINSTPKPQAPLVMRPSRGLGSLNLGDLWLYRELVYFLTWRDLKVRYKQTLLGATWAIIQPVLQMVVFTLLFDRLANLSSDNVPYPIFNYTALLPWGLFSKALTDAGRSLVANRNMITKVYFPRLVIPVSSVLSGVVDFLFAFVVLLGLMIYYKIAPTTGVWMLPLFLLLTLITALGVSLWLSALNVIYRDVGYVLPFLTQIWFFVTPIVYSSSEVSEQWRLLYALNPMVGVVDGFRWALLGTGEAPGLMVLVSTGVSLVILITGLYYFRHMERTFADEI